MIREKERIKTLENEVLSLKEENRQNVLTTTTRIDAMEEELNNLTTARDKNTQLAADQEQKILQLEKQLQEAHNLVEQLKQEKAELETEMQIQSQQVRYVHLATLIL